MCEAEQHRRQRSDLARAVCVVRASCQGLVCATCAMSECVRNTLSIELLPYHDTHMCVCACVRAAYLVGMGLLPNHDTQDGVETRHHENDAERVYHGYDGPRQAPRQCHQRRRLPKREREGEEEREREI